MSRFLALILGCSLLPVVASIASAQDNAGLRMYGNGVHLFHAGQYQDAVKSFQSADDAGLSDPRCFYFRGLALLKLDQAAAAEADFKKGAALEATDPALLPIVSAALQRVQGRVRVTIESHRAEARINAVAARESQKQALYGNRLSDVNDPISGQRSPPSADDPQLFGADATDSLVADPPADDASDLFPDDPIGETTTDPADDESADEDTVGDSEDDDGGLFGDNSPADDATDEKPADDDKPRIGLGSLRGIFGRALGSIIPDDQVAPAPAEDDPFVDDEPADDESSDDEPAGDEPAGDKQVDDEPTDESDDLFGDDPADEDADADAPEDDKSADDKSADDEPADDDDDDLFDDE